MGYTIVTAPLNTSMASVTLATVRAMFSLACFYSGPLNKINIKLLRK